MKKWIMLFALCVMCLGCEENTEQSSASGVNRVRASVQTQASGLTMEQENVKQKLELENSPGSVKHLYVISAYSGQVIIYSTVKGKVTSSGKRLTPTMVGCTDGQYVDEENRGMAISLGGTRKRSPEVLQDDGTYGSSISYLYWWDVQGKYHQHYVAGGQIVHISDQPLAVKSVIINMEVSHVD